MTCALGHEPTIEAYIGHLVAIYREVYRVLRGDGVSFVVMGDSFASSGVHAAHHANPGLSKASKRGADIYVPKSGLSQGNLMMVPHRLALALQADGWIVRNDCVFAKKAPMPESVAGWRWQRHRIKIGSIKGGAKQGTHPGSRTGIGTTAAEKDTDATVWEECPGCPRCEANNGYILRRGSWRHTRAHEFVFMLTKRMQYWADQEVVREALAESSIARMSQATFHTQTGGPKDYGPKSNRSARKVLENLEKSQGGRNPRSVLCPSSEPFPGRHFAVYPSGLITDLIKATCPAKCCPECGKGWAPVVKRPGKWEGPRDRSGKYAGEEADHGGKDFPGQEWQDWRSKHPDEILGYRPTCECGYEGLQPGDLETISTPTGSRIVKDPSIETGRAGYNRPRGLDEGNRLITRYEQRMYAQQLKSSSHRDKMELEAGSAFAHYIRTDRAGARPAPQKLLKNWVERGWIEWVEVPKGKEPEPVPGTIFDPLMGSGTTALVAIKLGRHYYGAEISPDYVELANERIAEVQTTMF